MGLLKLLKIARHALAQWKDLPGEERERLRGEADRVRHLTAELARLVSRRPAVQADGARTGPETADGRSTRTIVAELSAAVARLSSAIGAGAAGVVKDNSRTARVGSRLVSYGAKRAMGRREPPQA